MIDFSLTSEQRSMRDTARQFMEAEVQPTIRRHDRDGTFPEAEFRKLGELGFCGMLVPEEYGGTGASTLSFGIVIEEVARVDATCAFALSGANIIGSVPVGKYAAESLRKSYLPQLASGKLSGSFCVTEAQAGSDAAAIQTQATRDAQVYRIRGTKTWVTVGGEPRIYVVFAKTNPAAGGRGISAFLIEPAVPGIHVSRYEEKMGLRASPSAEIVFDCEVPVENLLGREGEGLKLALETLDLARIGSAAQAVGVAQGAMETAVRYAKQRRAFGQSISEFQAIQCMLADMQTEIEAARTLVLHAAWLRDSGARLGSAAARAKLYAAEMVNRVVYNAVQVHGAAGYSRECDVERMYRDARAIPIYEGTSEIQRIVIARELLAKPPK